MKPFLKRTVALLLGTTLLCSTALASNALGSRLYSYTLNICDDTTLTREVMWSASRSDLRTENYVSYTPSKSVSPVVSYGSSVLSKQKVTTMAQDLERDGKRVLSGINGDYFVMATGDPLGLLVTDGVMRSSASYLSALGFREDGSAVIGKPDLTLRADFKDYSLKITNINKIRTTNGYYLFTDDFGTTTKNTKSGIDVILTPSTDKIGEATVGADKETALTRSDKLGIGRMVSCTVDEVIEATGATPIPKGKFVLSISSEGGEWLQEMLRSLQPGDPLDVEVFSADTRWNDVDSAIGAMYRLIDNGKITDGLDASSAAPRTAVGVKPDGTVIFYTIDGRQSGLSIGATIQMVAMRLSELGCTDAILLDGGGSTTMVSTYPDYTNSSMVNSPSEGVPRSVTNAVFLISNLKATNTPGSLYVTPKSLTLLSGATTQCVASCVDTGYYPMKTLPGAVTWSSAENAVSDTGIFTAPDTTGVYTVSAQSGGVSGSTNVHVFSTPDSIYVTNKATGKNVSKLSLSPGDSVDLNAAASYRSLDLTGGDTCFEWTADSGIGTIDKNGVFTAGSLPGSGHIKVAAGKYAVTIAVTVDAPTRFSLLSDFEHEPFFSSNPTALTLDGTSDKVKYGKNSLKAEYILKDGTAALTANRLLHESDQYLSLWVYGDNSPNTLSAAFKDSSGTELTQILTNLSYSGWKQISVKIPATALTFTGLNLSGSQANGTIWLDQMSTANKNVTDETPPTVKVSVKGSSITAVVSDNINVPLMKEQVTLTVDGVSVDFSWDAEHSALTATLPSSKNTLQRVSITAADCSGNLGRGSFTVSGSEPISPFADMDGHWALPYTVALHGHDIITGVSVGDESYFYPNRPITRGDFALMTARFLGVNLKDVENVTLPYADIAQIPSWNLEAVKALYRLDIMKGSAGSDGKLYANAKASITRAEAMAILSRTQPHGYGEASLSAFSDAGKVPTWAKSHVASLVQQGVVGGSNGMLNPSDPVSRAEVTKLLHSLW